MEYPRFSVKPYLNWFMVVDLAPSNPKADTRVWSYANPRFVHRASRILSSKANASELVRFAEERLKRAQALNAALARRRYKASVDSLFTN